MGAQRTAMAAKGFIGKLYLDFWWLEPAGFSVLSAPFTILSLKL